MLIEALLAIGVVALVCLFFSIVKKENNKINNMWNGDSEDEK